LENFNIKLLVNKEYIQEEDENKTYQIIDYFKDEKIPLPLKLVCSYSKKNIMCDICE